MNDRKIIVWFRQDLRLHDNEALINALQMGDNVIPVYVFDERQFEGSTRNAGFKKTGVFRSQFILESVIGLRKSLQELGSDLVVRYGKPEEEVFKLAQSERTNWVFCNRERTSEEVAVQDALEKKLWTIGQEMFYFRGKLLYYTQDLPFPITHTPDTFTQFRKDVERFVPVRDPLTAPDQIPALPLTVSAGDMPSMADLGFEKVKDHELYFQGGEKAGLKRLNDYLWGSHAVKDYKQTRNELLGMDYSSKLSPWLAQGCLSPKQIYSELKRYETEHGENESTYWLYFELLWRDYFRLVAKRYGDQIFLPQGIKPKAREDLSDNFDLLKIWVQGRTGIPFIDANMIQLAKTGYMSNRGRQNVASFLINDLKVNWQLGAEYFESVLVDYDVASNWGNWNYLAGVGCDPRGQRAFNIMAQAQKYDPDGTFVKHWLPELQNLPSNYVHQPHTLSSEEQHSYKLKIGQDYPKAMV